MIIGFPKNMEETSKTYEFLLKLNELLGKKDIDVVTLDLINTKKLETSILAMISLILDNLLHSTTKILLLLPNRRHYSDKTIIMKIYNYYANEKKAFYKPRLLIGNSNRREVEDLILKFLKNTDIQNQNELKIMISEITANINMHVYRENSECKGYFSGAISKQKDEISISIINNGGSIRELLHRKKLDFENDESAILWALRKSNSTREKEETGGLGLYLIRKYTKQLDAEVTILSGECCMMIDRNCYDELDSNKIIVKSVNLLPYNFHGTSINLKVPISKATTNKIQENLKCIDLSELL